MPSLSTTASPEMLDDYLPVPTAMLVPGEMIGIEIFIRKSANAPMQLYRGLDVPFEVCDQQRLIDSGQRILFIQKSAHRIYQDYLRNHLGSVLGDERESVAVRFGTLSSVVRDVMANSFLSGDVEQMVEQSSEMADHCVNLMLRDDYASADLLGVLHHDYHTFTHSANVAFLCVMLAREMGIADADAMREIAIGGLLHDLGKLEIPDYILTKPGKLTELEYDQVQEHACWGFRKLCRRDDMTHAQLMMVYQHHERMEGGGYPVGCRGTSLHEWARICTIADVYEALTANRPYRRSLDRDAVLHIMQRGNGKAFDPEMLKCWLTIIRHR